MDGITDCAYRIICKQVFEKHGNPEDELMLWTEFMSADGYHHNPPGVIKHLMRSDYDHETIVQIFGGNEDTLVACALDMEHKYDFAGIELNMGCPSPKIMKCAAGSGMLKDKQKTLGILAKIAKNIDTPFSLKTRLGLTQDDIQEQFEFLIEASKYVSMIGVHGRTYKQGHSGYVDRDFIYRLKKALPHTTIIGNGGIRSYEQAISCLHGINLDKKTDLTSGQGAEMGESTTKLDPLNPLLDGIMPAQSAIGNPRILTPHTPTIQQRYDTIINHLNLSVACEIYFHKTIKKYDHTKGLLQPTLEKLIHMSNNLDACILDLESTPKAPVEFRKYLFNYISGLPDNRSLKQKIPPARDYHSLKSLIDQYFTNLLKN